MDKDTLIKNPANNTDVDEKSGGKKLSKRNWSFIAVTVFVLVAVDLLLFLPIGFEFIFTSHVDQIFLFIAVGFPCLISELKNPRYSKTILFAIAFLIFSCFSAIFSTQAWVSFFGMYIEGTGWLFYLACICAWAAGIKLVKGNITKEALMNILTVAAIANILFSLVQIEFSIHNIAYNGLIQFGDFSASGIFGNPVYFAEFVTGVLVMTLFRKDISSRAKIIILFLMGFGIELSGDRMALAVIAVAGLIVLIKTNFKDSIRFGLSIIVGYVIGFGVDYYFKNSPLKYQLSTSSLGVGFSARFELWKLDLKQILHNPLFGWGPESTIRAILPLYTSTIAKKLDAANGIYGDSHNFILELLLSVGVIGLIPLAIFFFRQIKIAKGPLAYFVLAIIPFALIEPLDIMVYLPSMVALGASTVVELKNRQIAEGVGENNLNSTVDKLNEEHSSNYSQKKKLLNITVGVMLFFALVSSVLLIADDTYYSNAPNTYYQIKVINSTPTVNFSGFNKMVELMPIYARYYYEYGKTYGVLAGLADKKVIARQLALKGEVYIEKALAMAPYSAKYSDILAQLQSLAGDNRAAILSYERSLRYDPVDQMAASQSCFLGFTLKVNNYKSLCNYMIKMDPKMKLPWKVAPKPVI